MKEIKDTATSDTNETLQSTDIQSVPTDDTSTTGNQPITTTTEKPEKTETCPQQSDSPDSSKEESKNLGVKDAKTPATSITTSPTSSPSTEKSETVIQPTATEESTASPMPPISVEETKKSLVPATYTKLQSPVVEYYGNKNILLTGATGFIGKAILWKLIHSLGQSLGRIYLLIRNGNTRRSKMGRPKDRIKNEILNNKAFVTLRHSMGASVFDDIIEKKVVAVSGDIISPDLSMAFEDREDVIENVNVVFHCAATVDYRERLDLSLETNTLGTLRLMDLADECIHMENFVHVSPAYLNMLLPDGRIQERVYPMELGDPEDLLKEIVALELQDIPKMTLRLLQHYPDTYTFTKSLTEHLILKRVDYNRVEELQGGKTQWPISIVRATHVGAGVQEPLPGWIDGVTGMNGMVFLLGHGIQAFQPDVGDHIADIVPVDYLSRFILGIPAFSASSPGVKFLLPYNEILGDEYEHSLHYRQQQQRQREIQYFPTIYQVSAVNMQPVIWKQIYTTVRHYWTRNSTKSIHLPTADQHFVTNKSIFRARMFIKYNLPQAISTAINGNNININNNGNILQDINNHAELRTIEMAARINEANQIFLKHQWEFENENVYKLESHLESDPHFRLSELSGYYTSTGFDWDTYMTNFSHGVHTYLIQDSKAIRNLTLAPGWDCALFSKVPTVRHSVINRQIESIVYSVQDIQKRTERMLLQVIACLEQRPASGQLTEEWIADFDSSLEDWCHDDSGVLRDGKHIAALGRWATRIGEHDEAIKIIVLNDRRVMASIRQITESSGVPQQTVVGEALKIVQRMRERTQMAYVWFAGSFLDTLFKRLFASIRVRDEDISRVKEQIKGKNVVYIPVSKTLLDQLLVWYICLRYHLPVPVIVCDEVLALLGPLSDILRIAGAYFIRRDKTTRSPLNTAVAAAYTETLLHEHGAVSMVIERTRSRTGRIQAIYADGILDMAVEATLERNQPTPRNFQQSPAPFSPTSSFDSHTTTTTSASFFDSTTPSGKETVVVPIHITYEKVPDLRMLIDQMLDQKSKEPTKPTPPPPSAAAVKEVTPIIRKATTRLARSATFLRSNASADQTSSTTNNDGDTVEIGKYGRVYVGIGNGVNIDEAKDSAMETFDKEGMTPADQYALISASIAKRVQRQQHSCTIVSPLSVVAAIILSGRTSNGLSLGKINELAKWIRKELIHKEISIDWQDEEDAETIVAYSLNLLDAQRNIAIEGGKRINENSIVRVVDHANNVMDLSYKANQITEIFLPEAIFSVVYLSYGTTATFSRDELFAKFIFLVRLLKDEFIYTWTIDETFDQLLLQFTEKNIIGKCEDSEHYRKGMTAVTTTETSDDYSSRICLFASFLYPTLDAYWITSCSLSALRDLPYMPRKIVPVLSQWIAAHLISGRRTVYREVLSTEASQNAVDNFMAIGFIDAIHPKTKLSPDAQILLLELGVKTNEDLVMVADRSQSNEIGCKRNKVGDLSDDDDGILSQLVDIASLCHEIEKYRFGTGDDDAQQRLGLQQNALVFDKCQQQIRSILRAQQSYASQHGMQLINDEESMIQLVYSLKASANMDRNSTSISGGQNEGTGRNPWRVSAAYNLKSSSS